jgi:hypothetical protein
LRTLGLTVVPPSILLLVFDFAIPPEFSPQPTVMEV